jgi:putative ABC transport system permease protein
VNFFASWRTAIRIARREARRAKGRSALVVAMIALPVLFLAFAAVSYDMFSLTGSEKADQAMGTGTARIQWPSRTALLQLPDPNDGLFSQGGPMDTGKPPTEADLVAALPPGSTVARVRRGTAEFKLIDGVARPDIVSVDGTSPLTSGYLTLLAGRYPTGAGELALSEQAMSRIGTSIGGTVSLADGKHSYTVVGQVEFPSLLQDVALFPPITGDPPNGIEFRDDSWIVHTPAPITWADVQQYNKQGMVILSRDVLENPPLPDQVPNPFAADRTPVDTQQLGIGVLVAGLALLEIVLMAGPAFAVSARRRHRQLALVAANGGTPPHVRRIVLADGVVLGFVGAIVGIVLGIVAGFIGRPFIEDSLAHYRAGGYRVFPAALAAIAALAVVTGLLAALVPAFITARQNIIQALAGRRGVTRSRKRWLVLGLIMAAGGSAIVMYGASKVDATIMLVGIVLGELGLVLCTPAMVGLIARIGRVLPVAPRIALRDAARNRAAASPAISAVMAAVAGSVAIGLIFVSVKTKEADDYHAYLPAGAIQVYLDGNPNLTATQRAASAFQATQALKETMPVTDVYAISQAVCPASSYPPPPTSPTDQPGPQPFCNVAVRMVPEETCPYLAKLSTGGLSDADIRAAADDRRCQDAFHGGPVPWVVDPAALATITGASGDDLQRATDTLKAGGVVVQDARYIKDGKVNVAVMHYDKDNPFPQGDPVATAPTVQMPAYLLTTGAKTETVLFSTGAVQGTGLETAQVGLAAGTSRMPTQTEEDRLTGRLSTLQVSGNVEHGPPDTTDPRLWILMAAAALVALAAAGVGTGLAAADGRQDLSTLASVGASPRMRRGLSLSQSGVIAGLGSILGALAGGGAAIAIVIALNQRYAGTWPAPSPLPLVVPWLSLVVALLVVPFIAMLGAGSLTRSRLPIERRL